MCRKEDGNVGMKNEGKGVKAGEYEKKGRK